MRSSISCTLLLLCTATLHAQEFSGEWVVESRASLAWWQIEPHYNHLWATTCPQDPAWQPGEGRSPGYYVNYLARARTTDADHEHAPVPLYPRKRVRYVCEPAVTGSLSVPRDYRQTTATISVRAEDLVSGLDVRDSFARRAVLQTTTYPTITFTLDSLDAVAAKTSGSDTLRTTATGTLELHGVRKTIRVPLQAWREGEIMRVKGQFAFPARDLVSEFRMSSLALGMGVTMGRWRSMHMGLDVVFVPAK